MPIVLVGHSMGGRAVLRAGGEDQVGAVCALAPWTPPGEPVAHLRGRTVVILHGRGDRWVPAALSAEFAAPALEAGARIARFTVAGGHSMVRRAPLWHALRAGRRPGGGGTDADAARHRRGAGRGRHPRASPFPCRPTDPAGMLRSLSVQHLVRPPWRL